MMLGLVAYLLLIGRGPNLNTSDSAMNIYYRVDKQTVMFNNVL
jgi:hypothetical protein